MINSFGAIWLQMRMYLMRRRQFDNLKLRSFFRTHYSVDVGLYSYGCFDRWRMPGPMRVGRYCSVASSVRTALNNHPTTALTTHPALYECSFGIVDRDAEWDGHLTIEDDVWIGHNVVILPGCKLIGRGAIIGAGSIVTRDVPKYAIVAGNPAKMIRSRFSPDLMEAIERSRWWEMELPALKALVTENNDLAFRPSLPAISDWIAQRDKQVGRRDALCVPF